MIPTYTDDIRQLILNSFINSNLVAALINYSALGLTDTPNATELDLRRTLDLTNIAVIEVGGTALNGYARQVITLPAATNDVTNEVSSSTTSVSFTASGGDFDDFTHVILITGADLIGAAPANGNNRGSTVGTVVYAEPVVGAPVSLLDGQTFNYNFTLNLASKAL